MPRWLDEVPREGVFGFAKLFQLLNGGDDQSGSDGLVGVVFAHSANTSRIFSGRSAVQFDFYWVEDAIPFQNQVDFATAVYAPVIKGRFAR